MSEKILVTGAAGYIGSTLTAQLLAKGRRVLALDSLSFGGESLLGLYGHPGLELVVADIRETERFPKLLEGVSGVVHLAAIVGDPACAKQPEVAEAINWTAAKALFDECAKTASVKRFVFASTCSNYGKMQGDGYVKEDSPLTPVSLYARLKVKMEQHILGAKVREDFVPVALRFSTVCGISPRMRFDLTVNEFAREMALGKELEVFGPQFWRPYCHVTDIARACMLGLEAPAEKVRGQVFGVGSTRENYTKNDIVTALKKRLPDAKVKFVERAEDPRDYRVDFTRIERTLGFTVTMSLDQTIDELLSCLKQGVWKDPYSTRFQNI
ncbi:MAG: NAD(P)-dependent oxidoreductase [Elusimicrobia bacterium]|nr:NAD(P)-dependent oxidoreductase [Elusimicrobiota bacterium]